MMADLIYPKIYFTRVQTDISDKEVLEIMRGYLNNAIRKRDGKPDTYKYYPDQNSPLSILSLEDPEYLSKNVVVSGIDQSYSFIRFAFQKLQIGNRNIYIKEPDFGIQRGPGGTYPSFYDRQIHDALLEGCGMRKQPIKLFTDEFWKNMVRINPKEAKHLLTYTITIDQKASNVKIDDFSKNPLLGVLQYSFQRVEKGKGELSTYVLEVEFDTRFGACQGKYYILGLKDDTLSVDEQLATRGRGFGVNGKLLHIAGVMRDKHYIPFYMIDNNIWIKRKVDREWKSYCLFCGNLYTLLGFHPDLTWIAASCRCPFEESIHKWKGDQGFFRLVLNYDYMHNSDRDIFDFNSQPLILMTRGLTPLYSSIKDFEETAYVTQVVEQKLVYRNLASKFKLATVDNVSIKLQDKKLSENNGVCHMAYLYNVRFSMPAEIEGGLWTFENRPSIHKVVLVPKSQVIDDPPSVRLMHSCSIGRLEGKIDRIMKTEGNIDEGIEARTIVDVRVWLPEGITFAEESPFFLVPRPPTSYIKSLDTAIDRWYSYLQQREKVTVPKQTHLSSSEPIVIGTTLKESVESNEDGEDINLKEKEKRAFVPGSAHLVKFTIDPNFVTDAFQQFPPSPCYHFGIILFTTSELNDENNTFNGVLRNVVDRKRPDKKLNITAIVKCKTEDLVLDTAVAVSMWSGVDDKDELLMNKMNENTFQIEDMRPCTDDNKIESDWDFFRMIQPCPVKSLTDLRDFLLYPTVPRVHHFKRPKSERKIEVTELINYADFNKYQAEGATNVLNHPLACVQGPPGCGKTYTLVEIINEIFHQHQSTNRGMVLIVCPTNHACKVVNEKIKEVSKGPLKQLKVRRMMAHGKETEKSKQEAYGYVHSSILLHQAYESNPEVLKWIKDKQKDGRNLLSDDQEESIKSHLTQVRNLVLDDTDVLICTVNTANNKILQDYFHGNRKESRECLGVAVDESNLVSVPQMLALLGLNPKYFALVGDHHQLSKFYNSKTAMNANAQTCMMRFLTATEYMKKEGPTTLLCEQYRYPNDLCLLISAWSYRKLLVSALSIMNRKYGDFPNPGFYEKFPALKEGSVLRVVYDESSAREKKDAFSYVNAKEVQIIVNLVNDIIGSGILQEKITVLSMYMSHLTKIREALGTNLSHVDVCTVDSYEGKEQSIVILSTVRCNVDADIGFVRDCARLNVGLSRTMDYLFYVSAEETFRNCKIPAIENLYKLMDDFKIPKIII